MSNEGTKNPVLDESLIMPLSNEDIEIIPDNTIEEKSLTLNIKNDNKDHPHTAKEEKEEKEDNTEQSNDENEVLFIGDRITINSELHGKCTGTIYYLNTNDALRIMPDGTSSILIDFPFVDGEFDPELKIYTDSDGSLDITRHEKGPHTSFVKWQSFRVDQILDGIKSNGTPVGKYKVVNINEADDRITLERDGHEITLSFDFQGIPRGEEFDILRISPTVSQIKVEEVSQDEEVVEEEAEFEEFELPDIVRVETILAEERVYPELSQKSDFKADLLSYLDNTSQKNPKNVKKIRAIIELFSSLKNSVIKRKIDGSIEGEEQISLYTLQDILSNRNIPIVRPVLDTKRIIMSEFPSETDKDLDQVLIRNLKDIIDKSNEYLKNLGDITATEDGIGMPRWFQALNSYFQKYPLGDYYPSNGYSFKEDAEYFRGNPPGSKTLDGLTEGYEGYSPGHFVAKIKQSLRRGHGPTVRGLVKGGIEIVIPSDKAPVNGYVLFPYRAVLSGYVGAIRTGTLWDIVLRSMSEYKIDISDIITDESKASRTINAKTIWMDKILENLGGVSNIRDAQNILYLDASNSSAVNIPFSVYLEMILQTVVVGGPGDLVRIKSDLGISEVEFTIEQDKLIQERVNSVIQSVRTMIRQMREKVPNIKPPTLQPVLETDYVANIAQLFEGEQNINTIFMKARKLLPGYKTIDLAIFGYLFKNNQDYLLACLSKNPLSSKRERILFNYDEILKILHDKNQERELERNKGFPPQPNPCIHTDNLTIIRKVKNFQERIALLKIFLRKFKGERRENWIHCTVCDQHLICHHEVLQIQQFIHPREHATIQKEIVLGYAGGTFGKNYICRNCGLPIAEMDYDTSIEYDDQGKPMSGRSELVDQDEIDREELELLLGPRVEKVQEIEFESNIKTECYKIAKVICDRIGISMNGNAYRQLVDRADSTFQQELLNEIEYKKLGRKEAYPRYLTGNKIAIIAALVLIEVQARIPNYTVDYVLEGCKPGFSGYPLVEDAKPESEEESIGVNYIICALAGFYPTFTSDKEKSPRLADIWANGYHKIKDTKTRTAYIKQLLINYLNLILQKDGKIQSDLEKKREYIKKLYGSAAVKGKQSEKISEWFLPRVGQMTEPVVTTGVKGQFGEEQQADSWIRGINALAKKSANIIKGSPFAETTCCKSDINSPGKFIKNSDLPPLPIHYSLKRTFARQSILYPSFVPRPIQESIGELSLDLSYRVFIQICWKGPRIGKAHEFGYDNKCSWCDLEVPTQYLYPDVPLSNPGWRNKNIQKEEEKQESEANTLKEEIKVSFTTQGISLDTEESLQNILDFAHKNTQFNTYNSTSMKSPTELLLAIGSVDAVPIKSWLERIQKSMINLEGLGPEATPVGVALALQPLEEGIIAAQEGIKTRMGSIGPALYSYLNKILSEDYEAIIEIIRSYFLIPLQRIRIRYDSEVTLRLPDQYRKGTTEKLSDDHIKELEAILTKHTRYLKKFNEETILPNSTLGQLKIDYFIEQISSILAYSSELRVSRMQFSDKISILHMEMFLKMIFRSVLIGTVWDLLNPQFTPEIEENIDFSSERDTVHAAFKNLFRELIIQYEEEKMSYNPTEVREKIAEAKEKEKQGFIQIFDNLPDEERQIELIKKRAKIGRWAQGNGKLAYSYDPDDYDRRRQEMGLERESYDMNVDIGAEEGYDGQDEQQKEEGEE